MADSAIDFSLHKRQGEAFNSTATEILYGGAAGGGKSHLMRVASIIWAAQIPGLQVYFFRRIREDLLKNHIEGPQGYRALLARWVQDKLCEIVDDEIRFWNGSKIYLCHCKDEKDRFRYQGAEIHLLLIDELTHFTDVIYRYLRGRVRAVGLNLPENFKGLFPRILAGSNPGGVGHSFVKATFVEGVQPMEIRRMSDSEGGMLRQYIPARLDDNPSMAQNDPTYRARLRGLGSESLVKAMEDGDWDVIEGAFFDCWSNERHVIQPFTIPANWLRFRSGDWGSAKPFSFGWWAVVQDDYTLPSGVVLQRGCLVRYREWYGCKKDANNLSIPNTGLKMSAEAVGAELARLERGDNVSHGVLDPACFAENGGPSISESLQKGSGNTVIWGRADNTRIAGVGSMGGWDLLRSRLIGNEAGPMLVCFSTCTDSIRTIPALQHDQHRPEDLDSSAEDHAADDWRYACASRPWVPVVNQPRTVDRWERAFNSDSDDDSWKTT